MTDDLNVYAPNGQIRIEPTGAGPLDGLTFVAKDLFDVAGYPTGGGNPDWENSNPIPENAGAILHH